MINLFIIAIAFIAEWIDSALGMGYGTILSPLLISLGFPPVIVVPSILITQAAGGLSAAFFHHKHGNAEFKISIKKGYGKKFPFNAKLSDDLKIVLIISSLGSIATIVSTLVAISIPKTFVSLYISILVIAMGIILLIGFSFKYTNAKMRMIGIISSFNKGLSGGGFGPVVTGGQIVLGQKDKKAIACTTASEPLICIVGFLCYYFLKGIPDFSLIFSLGIGALLAGPFGALSLKNLQKQKLKKIIAIILIILGMLSLIKTFNLINIPFSL